MAVPLSPAPSVPLLAVRWDQLPMMVRFAKALSDDALFEFCAANRKLRIERNAQGELTIMPPTGGETGRRNQILGVLCGSWALRDGTGVAFDSSTAFILPNGAEPSPDFARVRKERWQALPLERRKRFPPLCPDFVVELMSPSNALADLQMKMREYLANGAQLGWLLLGEELAAYVYRPGREPERVEAPTLLSGEDTLPGFSLDLNALA